MNFKLRAEIFYFLIVLQIISIIFIFTYTDKGFSFINDKKEIIEFKKEKIEELKRRKIQLSSNIYRLKYDREYIVSYAKTFGYLDSSKNEKIIKIIKENNNIQTIDNIEKRNEANYIYTNNDDENRINTRMVIILSSMIAICFVGFILINRNILIKKHS